MRKNLWQKRFKVLVFLPKVKMDQLKNAFPRIACFKKRLSHTPIFTNAYLRKRPPHSWQNLDLMLPVHVKLIVVQFKNHKAEKMCNIFLKNY